MPTLSALGSDVSKSRRTEHGHARFVVPSLTVAGLVTSLATCLATSSAHESPLRADENHGNRTLVSIRIAGSPLRDALIRLGRTHGRSVFLDRRVDPSQPVEINVQSVPLMEAITRIARKFDLGATRLGTVAYVGPDFATARLRTLCALRWADVEAGGASWRNRLSAPIVLNWPRLATPRSIFQQIARKSGVQILDLDRVPHDLWPAGDLPALPAVELLTLIGNGLDLTFAVSQDGRAVHLVPINPPVSIEKRYSIRPRRRSDFEALIRHVPNASVKLGRHGIRVRGRVEDHQRVVRWLNGDSQVHSATSKAAPAVSSDGVVQRHSLKVRNQPLSRVVRRLVDQLSADIQFDEPALGEAGLSIDAPVTVDVRDAPLDELLQKLVAPAGLRILRVGDTYRIVPAQ